MTAIFKTKENTMTFYSGSDSTEYNNFETEVIDWLSSFLSQRENKEIIIKHKYRYIYEDKKFFELDGYGGNFAVEIYLASDLRGSKIDKVSSDILKLTLLPDSTSKVFVCPEVIKNKLERNSWVSFAIRKYKIEILVPDLKEETKEILKKANKRNRESILKTSF
jgi:hypothetical protein